MPLITTLVGAVLDGRRMVGTTLVANVDRRALDYTGLVLMELVQSCPIGLNQFFQWWSSSCCISWKIVDIASSTLCSTENPKVGPAGDLHHGWLPHIWQNIWLGMHMIALVAGYTIGKEDIRISRLESISTASKQVRTSIEAGFDSFTSRQEWKTLGKLGSKLLYFCCMFHVSSGLGSLAWRKWRRRGVPEIRFSWRDCPFLNACGLEVAKERWKVSACGIPSKQHSWIVAYGTTRQTALVEQTWTADMYLVKCTAIHSKTSVLPDRIERGSSTFQTLHCPWMKQPSKSSCRGCSAMCFDILFEAASFPCYVWRLFLHFLLIEVVAGCNCGRTYTFRFETQQATVAKSSMSFCLSSQRSLWFHPGCIVSKVRVHHKPTRERGSEKECDKLQFRLGK